MPIIFPKNPIFNDNIGEQQVYNYLKLNLHKDEVCYYNYNIEVKEFDFCVMVPNKGILIIEVKSWLAKNIIEVKDNLYINYKTKDGIKDLPSPYRQASGYAKDLINKLRRTIKRDIFVLPLVWYVNVSKDEYYAKRLDIISDSKVTLFREDLEDKLSFSDKVEQILNFAIKYYKKIPDTFNNDTLNRCRELFQSKEQIEAERSDIAGFTVNRRSISKQHYSVLRHIPKSDDSRFYSAIVADLLKHWAAGTKLYLIANDKDFIEILGKQIQEKMEQFNINNKFNVAYNKSHLTCYNINCYYAETKMIEDFTIIDGDKPYLLKYKNNLEIIDSMCGFNVNQYMVEHGSNDKDIVVKAGAGTGKTHTMISRIMYLIHTNRLSYKDLMETIIMITFTNEAADQMKKKIKKEIQDYYILTGDYDYFQMISIIEQMNISTIHSLVLRILQRYSEKIGYGKDLSIATGIIERKLELEKSLNRAIKEDGKTQTLHIQSIIDEFDLTLYHFQKLVEALFKKLENKNIDILNILIDLDDSNDKDFNNLLKRVLLETEKNTRGLLKRNNLIKLSHLIIELSILYDRLKGEKIGDSNIQYLFVDEFQDTDNIQIDLISKFQRLFGFNLFIVGDIKQCIYRFRGAEEDAFEQIKTNKGNWEEYELVKNYRTDKYLLNDYGVIFEKWGEVGRLPYIKEVDMLTSDRVFNNPEDDYFKCINVSSNNQTEFEKKLINELKIQLEELKDDGKIAVLVRENKEAEAIINIGKRHEINIDSTNIGGLYKIESTLDFYKLVLALQNNKSPKHLINLYDTNYINRNIDVKEIFQRRGNKKELHEFIMDKWPIKNWDKYLNDLRKDTVLKVLREIIRDLTPWNNYSRKYKDSEDRLLYYKRNLDLLFEKLSTNKNTDYLTLNKIQEFLSIMITTNQQDEVRAELDLESKKEILCMTVHKAKGLEFDTVILPYTNLNISGGRKGGEYDFLILDDDKDRIRVGYKIRRFQGSGKVKANNFYLDESSDEREYRLKEETRILYVALTRAKKNLVIFKYKDNSVEHSWQNYLK